MKQKHIVGDKSELLKFTWSVRVEDSGRDSWSFTSELALNYEQL